MLRVLMWVALVIWLTSGVCADRVLWQWAATNDTFCNPRRVYQNLLPIVAVSPNGIYVLARQHIFALSPTANATTNRTLWAYQGHWSSEYDHPTVSVFTSGTTDFVFVVSAGSVTAIVEGKEKYSISNRAWNMIIVDSYLVIFGSNGVAVYDLFLGVFIWGYSPPQMGLLGVMNQTVVVHTFVYDRHANTVLLFGLDDGFLIQKFENVTGVSGTNDMTPESPYLPVLALDNASQIHLALLDVPHAKLLWTLPQVAEPDIFVYQTSTKFIVASRFVISIHNLNGTEEHRLAPPAKWHVDQWLFWDAELLALSSVDKVVALSVMLYPPDMSMSVGAHLVVSELTGATLAALDEAKSFYDCAHFYATRTDLLIPNSNGWWRYEQRSITTARPSYKSANYSCVMSVVPFSPRSPMYLVAEGSTVSMWVPDAGSGEP